MKRKHDGFTLVELLVVITIISILMGLLIPAVNAARETARFNQCGVRVKNLALAAIQHENTKGYFPGWVDKYGVFVGGVDRSDLAHAGGSVSAHIKVGGYGVALLPWLDAQPTYEHWTDDSYPVIHEGGAGAEFTPTIAVGASNAGAGYHPLAAPNLPNFQCPSSPNVDAQSGRNAYITNNGMCFLRTAAAAAAGGGVTAGVTQTQVACQNLPNGIFKARYLPIQTPPATPYPAGFGLGPNMSLDDIKDGKTHMALFSENIQALPWHFAGFLNGSGVAAPNLLVTGDPNNLVWADVNPANEFTFSQFANGMVWHFEDPQAAQLNALGITSPTGLEVATDDFKLHKINGGGNNVSQDIQTLQMTLSNCMELARPSSVHVDQVQMGFADGGNRAIPSSIDYRVYQALLTSRGKSANVPWPEFVLTDQLEN